MSAKRGKGDSLAGRLVCLALAAVVLAPIAGLLIARLQPMSLFEPPPVSGSHLIALFAKTISLAFLVSVSACALGSWFAWIENRCDFIGRKTLSLLALVPLAIPSYVLAAILREAWAPKGVLGTLFNTTDAFVGFWPSGCVLTLSCTPYSHLLVSAALKRSPIQEEQAARLLGASRFGVFRQILLPRLKGPMMYAFLLTSLYVVSDFGAVAVLDCDVLTWELYNQRNGRSVFSIGLLLLMTVLPFIIGVRWLRAEEVQEYAVAYNSVHRERLDTLGTLGTGAAFFLVIFFGAVLPTCVLLSWIYDGYIMNLEFVNLTESVATTLKYSTMGALLIVVLTVCLCFLMINQGRVRKWLDVMIYLPSSLPGILVAVGLFQLVLAARRNDGLFSQGVVALESIGVVLILAYTARFVAQAYAALRPGFNRLDPQLELAARSLGAHNIDLWKKVRLPSLAPGLAVAFSLSFFSIAKELPITLTLAPLASKTIAYRIFDAQAEGALPDVGLASIVLLGVLILVHVFTQHWRGRYEH